MDHYGFSMLRESHASFLCAALQVNCKGEGAQILITIVKGTSFMHIYI